jgi:hypothetical protein
MRSRRQVGMGWAYAVLCRCCFTQVQRKHSCVSMVKRWCAGQQGAEPDEQWSGDDARPTWKPHEEHAWFHYQAQHGLRSIHDSVLSFLGCSQLCTGCFAQAACACTNEACLVYHGEKCPSMPISRDALHLCLTPACFNSLLSMVTAHVLSANLLGDRLLRTRRCCT